MHDLQQCISASESRYRGTSHGHSAAEPSIGQAVAAANNERGAAWLMRSTTNPASSGVNEKSVSPSRNRSGGEGRVAHIATCRSTVLPSSSWSCRARQSEGSILPYSAIETSSRRIPHPPNPPESTALAFFGDLARRFDLLHRGWGQGAEENQ